MTLIFDLLTLKVVSESRVTWATSVPILVFLGLSILELRPMYATYRQTDRRQTKASLNAPPISEMKRGMVESVWRDVWTTREMVSVSCNRGLARVPGVGVQECSWTRRPSSRWTRGRWCLGAAR